ncbi:glycoside hydrolase [Mycena amicta]|nr:glycoside hydrolase [Mycena amicta]
MLALLFLGFIAGVSAQSQPWGQCGGVNWTGPTTCTTGWACAFVNDFYSQCLQGLATTPTGTTSSTVAASSTKTASSTWNSWNAYGCSINEAKILAAANQFVSLGLKDCWSITTRNASTKQIIPDSTKFPNGIASVATQIHNLGLKFGIYSDAGTATCSGFPGSLGNENLDASTFASWGVDYLKYDNCNIPANWTDGTIQNGDWYNSNSAIRYRQMTAALVATGRAIQFNLVPLGKLYGHSWRLTGGASASWAFIAESIAVAAQHVTSDTFGAHGDMDMLEIGNGALTIQEQRTHFAAWIMLKSPILLGTDLSLLNSTQLAIITNAELLAFHQDTIVGAPAAPFTPFASAPTTSTPEYFSGKSSKGTHVFIVNTGSAAATKMFTFSAIPGLGTGTFSLHDMWTGTDLAGTFSAGSTFSVTVQPHDTVAYLVKVM